MCRFPVGKSVPTIPILRLTTMKTMKRKPAMTTKKNVADVGTNSAGAPPTNLRDGTP